MRSLRDLCAKEQGEAELEKHRCHKHPTSGGFLQRIIRPEGKAEEGRRSPFFEAGYLSMGSPPQGLTFTTRLPDT
jgi:hypothetical protein